MAYVSTTTLWYATRATGITALVLLTATMVMGLLTAKRTWTRRWPGFAQQELHRRLSIVTVAFVAIHVLTSVIDTYVHIGWLAVVVPFVSPYKPFWVALGAIALDLLLAVFITSLLREHLSAGSWRAVHWVAYGSWPVALAHPFGMGTDSREHWVTLLGVICVAAVGGALLWRVRARAAQLQAARRVAAGQVDQITSLRLPRHVGSAR